MFLSKIWFFVLALAAAAAAASTSTKNQIFDRNTLVTS